MRTNFSWWPRVVAVAILCAGAWLIIGTTAASAATITSSAPAAGISSHVNAGVWPAADLDTALEPRTPGPAGPKGPGGDGSVTIDLNGLGKKPSTPIVVLIGITLMSLAPAILMTCTSFTKILVVLGLTRNALGLQQTPPNQVIAGLALFLSLFIMAPVLAAINHDGVQPYLNGNKTSSEAFGDGIQPLRGFMLAQTGDDELMLLTNVAKRELPDNRDDVAITTLVPAFVLSELRQAFIIGFVIFIPFLVIDIVVSAALMSLGMMMMPPVMVSLPFKLLLFVMIDGWGLIIKSLVASYG